MRFPLVCHGVDMGASVYARRASVAAYPAAVLSLLVPALLSLLLLSPPPSARFLRLELLKSVSYQPLPFSRKPAAEIFLTNAGSAQAGQSTRRTEERRVGEEGRTGCRGSQEGGGQ